MEKLKPNNIAVDLSNKIFDLADTDFKKDILENITIHGNSEPDNSAVFSFQWYGYFDNQTYGNRVLDFFYEIRDSIISGGKEAVEQEPPHCVVMRDCTMAVYRVRVWDNTGAYEKFGERKMEIVNG